MTQPFPPEPIKQAAAAHHQRGNAAFRDGHVAILTFKQLFFDTDDASLQRWNEDHQPHLQ